MVSNGVINFDGGGGITTYIFQKCVSKFVMSPSFFLQGADQAVFLAKTIKSLDWQRQLIRRPSKSPGSPGRKWGKGKKFERFGNVWKVIFIRDFNNKI